MGIVDSILYDRFPRQGTMKDERVTVCFAYDTTRKIKGTVLRDDREPPYETIIRLDDGRVVRACECMYSLGE